MRRKRFTEEQIIGILKECLNEHWFFNLGQARETIETWRLDYNAVRPHSALGDVPPEEFELLTRNPASGPIVSS